ncbi:MAG: hypothetical protein AAGM38_04300 [Pseudomonadota bacterium]
MRAVERLSPYAATRIIGALAAEFGPLPRERLLRHPALAAAERGGAVRRRDVAVLRKALIRALLPETVDHRSGVYHRARAAVSREVALELGAGARAKTRSGAQDAS